MLTTSLVAFLAAATPASAQTSAAITVKVSRTAVSRPIPPGFVGFSFEFEATRAYTGSNPRAVNPVLVQLIRNLAPGQAPVLRIGGNSTDTSWWPVHGVTPSPGITYTLTRSWLATTRALAAAAGARLILGLNLKLNSAAELVAEAHAFQTGIGRSRIEGLEIGNEPELYGFTPWYYDSSGAVVHARPPAFDFAAYIRDVSALARRLKGVPLAGPATGFPRWVGRLPELFAAEPGLKVITYHRYPLIRCFTQPGDPGYPTIPNLLGTDAARDVRGATAANIAFAHSHHALFRVDELNSVACMGQPGVSDTFASALWVTDTLFALARAGVDGVNIHTLPDAAYHPFTFQRVRGRWLGTVEPEYYGMLLFTRAAPPGSRMLAVSQSPNADVRVRATLTPQGVVHVVLINDNLTANQIIRLRAPAGAGKLATLERLRAPSVTATDGVTLAGQGFGAETATGNLTGRLRAVRLKPVHGRYLIQLPAASAEMVSFVPAAS
jgi:hypothetical protein